MKKTCLPVLFFLAAPGAFAQVAEGPSSVLADEVQWKAPGSLPPGAEFHPIYENKQTRAVQTLVRFPKGFFLPPHSHTHDETIVVIKGKLVVEMGGREKTLTPGSYAFFPAGTTHALRAKGWGGCRLLVSLSGPFDILGLSSDRSAADWR